MSEGEKEEDKLKVDTADDIVVLGSVKRDEKKFVANFEDTRVVSFGSRSAGVERMIMSSVCIDS